MTDPIPDRVRLLLERYFTSVSQLEVLVVLVKYRRPWTPPEVASELGLNEDHVRGLLASLVRARLVAADQDRYEFGPAAATARGAAEDLAKLYDRYRVRILNIIFSKPSGQVRDFADAFRLRPRADDEQEDEDG